MISMLIFLVLRLLFYRSERMPGPTDFTRYKKINQKKSCFPLKTHWTVGPVISTFFRSSLCFMYFWFGLEILRLVYKKTFLKYCIVSILFDHLSSRNITTLKFIWNCHQSVSKDEQFCVDLKNVRNSCVKQKPHKILQKNRFLNF